MIIRAVHIGSQSIDSHTNSQAAINAVISAITTNIPNASHIAIGTYFDYGSTDTNDQFNRWATAIHNAGLKMIVRSSGHNDWQGRNSVAQYTNADFEAHALTQIQTWIDNNYSIFQGGDIFLPFPDEPENNSMWNSTYGTIGSGAGQTAFNSFITTAISNANSKFTTYGVTGVSTNYVWNSPSTAKDVITSATAANLVIGADSYPETVDTTPAQMEASMQTQITAYLAPMHNTRNKNINFGPSVYTQLSEADQADALTREFNLLKIQVSTLRGYTLWQFGATDNGSKSRLFDYTAGNWVARSAAGTLNTLFSGVSSRLTPSSRSSASSRLSPPSRSSASNRNTIA